MKKRLCVLPILAALTACAGSENGLGPSGEDAVIVANNEATPTASSADEEAMTPDAAKRAALNHVSLQNRSWGQPQEIVDQGDEYLVTFDTPDRELRLIGQRAVTVDKSTGVVSYRKRR